MVSIALAAAALPAGFAAAEATGVRGVGGVMLAALATGAVLTSRSSKQRPPWPTSREAAWAVLLVALFVLSHVLADPLTTWGAVALASAAAGAGAAVLLS